MEAFHVHKQHMTQNDVNTIEIRGVLVLKNKYKEICMINLKRISMTYLNITIYGSATY